MIKALKKRFLSLVMAFAMFFFSSTTSAVVLANETETSNAMPKMETVLADGIMPMGENLSLIVVIANINKLEYSATYKSGAAGYWTPYIGIDSGGATFCVHAVIYKLDGTRVCGMTYNVMGNQMDGEHCIANISLSPTETYVCKLIFDRKTTIGSVSFIAR